MKAVLDTSPLCYLVLIEEIGLLPSLFGEVMIPRAVAAELGHSGAPPPVRRWAASPPSWLQTHTVSGSPLLPGLHAGESEAIALAQESNADIVVIDEKAARQAALDLGLRVTGLLGLLDAGAKQGLLDLPAALERLQATNFRARPALLRYVLDRHARRLEETASD